MNANLVHQSLQYLPVDIGGQLFAIPLKDVIAVQQRGHAHSEIFSMPPLDIGSEQVVPAVDLSKLFWNIQMPDTQGAIVVIATFAGACGLLVDHVHPASVATVEQRQSLPFSMGNRADVCAEAIIGAELPILMLDCQRLVELITHVAPEYVASVENAT